MKQYNIGQPNIDQGVPQEQFELVGTKADMRYERKLELSFWKYESGNLITRAWRGYKARMLARFKRHTRASIII